MFSGIASSGRIYVPINSLRSYQTAENWSNLQLYLAGYDYENKKFIGTELFYTSTDGAIVTPYSVENLGANIVSNTYENGQGIMKFDATIIQIGAKAFNECATLKSIIIPDGVSTIGSTAFRNCTSLTSVTIPDSIISIGGSAFYGCSSLTSVAIPDGIISIGGSAFYGCSSLTSVAIPEGVTSVGSSAFRNCTSLTSITIPDSVTKIGQYAFYGCSSLTSVTIPEGVTSIGNYAFYDCTSLTEVYCKPTTPPTGYSYMFNNNASGRKIYVPTASLEAYKVAEYWSDYADYIVGYNF